MHTGPLSMAPSQMGVFTHSSIERRAKHPDEPNIQFHVQPLSLPLASFGAGHLIVNNFTLYVILLIKYDLNVYFRANIAWNESSG